MFNHNRGLWGYTGAAPDGEPLTIQSTGMGGPSAAIVISELADLGARTMLRVGTCGALRSDLELGDLLVATEAIADDGTSRALGVDGRVPADAGLLGSRRSVDGDARRPGPGRLDGPVLRRPAARARLDRRRRAGRRDGGLDAVRAGGARAA